jgi:urea transport system ATP-binding protein
MLQTAASPSPVVPPVVAGAQPMLTISDLHAAYGQSEVLHGIDIDVAPGEIVAVMGRNGMGKSTLMKTLMGIVPTKSGMIHVDGVDVTAMKSHARVAKGLAYVPQGRMIFSTMTVQENIETGLTVTGSRKVPRTSTRCSRSFWR